MNRVQAELRRILPPHSRCQGDAVVGECRVFLQVIRTAVLFASLSLFFSGCAGQLPLQVGNWLADRKAESLEDWEAVTVAGTPLMESLESRVALVLVNFDSVSVEVDDSGLSVIKGIDEVRWRGFGSAVPVTDDGYFLTVAHVVDDTEKLHLVVGLSGTGGRRRVEGVPARVVWTSEGLPAKEDDRAPDEAMPELDFAIIHSEAHQLPPLVPFPLAGEVPDTDESVICAGWPIIFFEDFSNGARLAAGKIVAVHRQKAYGPLPAFLTVQHDAPFVFGDSGGPLLDRKGNLVGINSTFHFSASWWQVIAIRLGHRPKKTEELNYLADAYMPEPNWLWQVIADDRERSQAGASDSN